MRSFYYQIRPHALFLSYLNLVIPVEFNKSPNLHKEVIARIVVEFWYSSSQSDAIVQMAY